MGALGSKEDLGQIVAIYGYNPNDFPWRSTDSRSVYQTSGLIIDCHDKKYVVTTRQRLISCKNIVMYHSYFRGIEEPVMRNDLQIIFQFIEFNIIILTTKDCDELDLAMSEIISGYYDPKIICPTHDIMKNHYTVPTKKSQYHTVRMDIDLNSETINYDVHIYDVKFIKSIIYDKSYVPDTYMYEFALKNIKNTKLFGICGAIIFNKKFQLVGIISQSEGKSIYVLPANTLTRIITDFTKYSNSPDLYNGPALLPFSYDINNDSCCIITENANVHTEQNNKLLKKNDIVISVAGYAVQLQNEKVMIYDNNFKDNIPLDMHISLNFDANMPFNLVIKRKGKTISMDIFPIHQNKSLALTNMPYFCPLDIIPYVNINGVIIVQLTHELLDVTYFNKKILQNIVIDDYFENKSNNINVPIIIDCLDDTLAKKYELPQFINSGKKKHQCPFVTMANGMIVSSLQELENIIQLQPVSISLKTGLTFDDQQIIIL